MVRRLSRRAVLLGAGRGTLAVAVLGVAACASDDTGSGAAGGSTPTVGDGASAGTQGSPASEDPAAAPPAPVQWERVALGSVSAYVLVRGREAAIVDTGNPGSAGVIGDALQGAGLAWSDVRHVVLTHAHSDHAGSVGDVMERATAATAWVGAADRGAVRTSADLQPLEDGDEVFGLQVVATPGHTAGHVCVFDPETGVLVAGDALGTTNGLAGSNPRYTADPRLALISVDTLAALAPSTILVGHGDPLEVDAAAALTALAAST